MMSNYLSDLSINNNDLSQFFNDVLNSDTPIEIKECWKELMDVIDSVELQNKLNKLEL